MIATAVWLTEGAARELALFAAVGLLLGGLDDLLVDLLWIGRQGWKRAFVYTRHARATVATLASPGTPGRIAVLVGAWDEAAVIGDMLRTACRRWAGADVRIYVGLYPNDPGTVAAVRAVAADDPRVRPVAGTRPGPTTKAEALNRCWAALLADEAAGAPRAKAILQHDAEDAVHAAEIGLFDTLIERFDLVQLPVLPEIDPASRWIAGHYADEFSEAHGKQLVVREWVGAAVPLAGTGCAISRAAIEGLAAANGGAPFEEESLTEDYELGLRVRAAGGRCAFVRITDPADGRLVAVRAHFPATFDGAVRQKTRWLRGIAFAGWDRLGWTRGLAENWMRLRDRRAPLAALVLATAYAAVLLFLLGGAARLGGGLALPSFWPISPLFVATSALLGWRTAMRFVSVARVYGWREGLRSMPRLLVGNVIAIAAAWRALVRHVEPRAGEPHWDKTAHVFPAAVAAE